MSGKMSKITTWFTSDNHFSHARILEYANRPFRDVNHMDAEMIDRWNRVVDPGDTVYHLGDFCLGGGSLAGHYFSKLNGQIKVLGYPWHHDKRWLKDVNKGRKVHSRNGKEVEILPPMVVLEFEEFSTNKYPKAIVLCHYRIAEWERRHYGSWHLFGHSHGKIKGKGLSMDCGVDANDFYPIALSAVARDMRNKDTVTGA